MSEQLSNKDFDFIYSKVPRACVDLLINTTQGLLLVKREDPPEVGTWHMPGGGIRFQETIKDAAKRIAKRELGVDIELGQIVDFIEYLHEPRRLGEAHSIGILISATIKEDMDKFVNSDKVSAFKVIPENILSAHKLVLERLGFLT